MSDFDFIDLFAGIGGIRIAFEQQGGRCVMTSEIDRFARQTYETYFKVEQDEHFFNTDITALLPANVPDHDILLGGFPCQPFSIAGVSKKNSLGRDHGFKDPTKGTLFFNIKELLLAKRPAAFLLENVKNLRSHDRGKTWEVIERTLENAGYAFTDNIIDAATVVPQHRERVFIVGFDRHRFDLPDGHLNWEPFWKEVERGLGEERAREAERYGRPGTRPRVGDVLEPHEQVPDKYTLSDKLWNYLREYKKKHQARGNGFGYGLVTEDDHCTRTLSARYYKDGSEVLVSRGESRPPRRLTPRECARLQGFPLDFEVMFDRVREQPVSDTQAYKQFGNSVSVPVVRAIAAVQLDYLRNPSRLHELPELMSPTSSSSKLTQDERCVI